MKEDKMHGRKTRKCKGQKKAKHICQYVYGKGHKEISFKKERRDKDPSCSKTKTVEAGPGRTRQDQAGTGSLVLLSLPSFLPSSSSSDPVSAHNLPTRPTLVSLVSRCLQVSPGFSRAPQLSLQGTPAVRWNLTTSSLVRCQRAFMI